MRYLLIFLLACPCAVLAGQSIYRSVDENGVVTYSSKPVPGAVDSKPLVLPPGPTEEQKADARARLERTRQLSREFAEARKARPAKSQAEQEEEEQDRLTRSGTSIGARKTREEVGEEARGKFEELKESVEHTKESARDELARRREERSPLPGQPVHIQPVPGPGDNGGGPGPNPVRIQPVPPGGGATPGQRGGGRKRRGG